MVLDVKQNRPWQSSLRAKGASPVSGRRAQRGGKE